MKHIICLDIENTIIDDLQNCNFIEENCEKIKRLIDEKLKEGLLGIVFNTWGWTTNDEIDINIINRILVKFCIDPLNIGCECRVFTKEFSVDKAIEAGWLHKEDKERALHPGMMQEFGISKIACFQEYVGTVPELLLKFAGASANNPIVVTLVDDLVDEPEIESYRGNKLHAAIINPTQLA